VPDVTLGELRSLAYLVNERLRHAHPDARMLTMAAPSGTGATPAAVTVGGGAADVRRTSSRRSVLKQYRQRQQAMTYRTGRSVSSPVIPFGGGIGLGSA